MRSVLSIIVGLSISIIAPLASGHQPVLAIDGPHSRTEPFIIEKPEISKAIYSVLSGSKHYYKIVSQESFRFYVVLTKPKIDECSVGKTFSFDILNEAFEPLAVMSGSDFEWWPWFEEFGRKWYWIGPEFGENFKHSEIWDPGTYYIRVYNENNLGNYVLATGDIESFPIGVMARMLRELPKINRIFWKDADCNS